jgi:WD40 repeat protein
MGALGEARAAQFTERYAAVVESAAPGEESDPPPFHYGTHYSCAGYILYYLLRLEPFSRLALSLQGGKFDKPDRLFRDIQSSWESASSENLQDVRELIPEFFYLPEFLQNFNRFDFGITQRGLPVHHVVLPPWAKGDPREFVMIQRRALESDYVSRHLHSWIDLIFGYKQRGEEAVLAQNVFVHLTYEGEVDLDAIEDPMLREATLAQIHNFGQTPSRLFSRPHPRRETPTVLKGDSLDLAAIAWREPGTPPLCIVGAPEHIAMKPVAVAGAVGPAGTREAPISDAVYDRDRDRVVAVSSGALLWRRSSDVYIRYGGMAAPSGVSFHSVAAIAGARAGSTERALSCHSHLHDGEVTAAACAPDGRLLITGGTDAAVRVWTVLLVSGVGVGPKTRSLKLMGVLAGHSSSIVCLDVCVSNGLLVSGGKDARVMVWDLARCSFVRELPGHRVAISSVSINPTNGNMVTLSGPELRVWTVNGDVLARCSVMSVRRSLPTCAVATACADWQDGVAAVTGHANGDVSLWGIAWGGKGKDAAARRNSSTLERQSSFDDGNADPREDEDVLGGLLASRHSQPRGLTLLRVLSNAHSRSITCLRVCGSTPGSQRELLAGDEKGVVSRWQTIRLVDLTSDELGQLFPRRNQKEEEVVTGASTSLPLGPLSSNATAL